MQMYKHIRANERGSTLLPWLRSYHSFSFNQYYDPARMGFGPLRVVNQDWVAPGGGFSLRTDARDYALEALDNLEAREDLENRFSAGEWAPRPLYPFETPYEIKFKAQGLRIYYFEYRKRAET